MSYRVRFLRAAEKEFLALSSDLRDLLRRRIDELARNPRAPHVERLTGTLRGLRKLRVGAYRVSYEIDDDAQVVTVVEVGHRSRIYQRFKRRRG